MAALVEELAGVRWHGFLLGKAAVRAGQYGFKNDGTHRVLTIAPPLVAKRNGHHVTAAVGENNGLGYVLYLKPKGQPSARGTVSVLTAAWGRGRPASAPARTVPWLVLWGGASVVGASGGQRHRASSD